MDRAVSSSLELDVLPVIKRYYTSKATLYPLQLDPDWRVWSCPVYQGPRLRPILGTVIWYHFKFTLQHFSHRQENSVVMFVIPSTKGRRDWHQGSTHGNTYSLRHSTIELVVKCECVVCVSRRGSVFHPRVWLLCDSILKKGIYRLCPVEQLSSRRLATPSTLRKFNSYLNNGGFV